MLSYLLINVHSLARFSQLRKCSRSHAAFNLSLLHPSLSISPPPEGAAVAVGSIRDYRRIDTSWRRLGVSTLQRLLSRPIRSRSSDDRRGILIEERREIRASLMHWIFKGERRGRITGLTSRSLVRVYRSHRITVICLWWLWRRRWGEGKYSGVQEGRREIYTRPRARQPPRE